MSRFTNQIIKQYVREPDPSQIFSKGNPVGVILVRPNENGTYSLGWSQCSRKDRFSKEHGTMIAQNRLENSPMTVDPTNPSEIFDESWRDETFRTVMRTLGQAHTRNERDNQPNS